MWERDYRSWCGLCDVDEIIPLGRRCCTVSNGARSIVCTNCVSWRIYNCQRWLGDNNDRYSEAPLTLYRSHRTNAVSKEYDTKLFVIFWLIFKHFHWYIQREICNEISFVTPHLKRVCFTMLSHYTLINSQQATFHNEVRPSLLMFHAIALALAPFIVCCLCFSSN